MWNRRLCYLLLLGEGAYLFMLYDYQGLRFLVGFLLLFPLVCLLLLLLSVPACRVELKTRPEVFTRGEQAEARVLVENRGLLPVARVLVCICWAPPGQREVRMKKWVCGLGRGCKREAVFVLSGQHCGRAGLRVSRLRVYDYLGLLWFPRRVHSRENLTRKTGGHPFRRNNSRGKREYRELCIVPRVDPVSRQEAELLSPGYRGEEDGDLVLRDYRPGDSLRRVHWKLSEKLGRLQMREREPEGLPGLYLDFSPGLRTQPDQWDRYLDRACSLLYFLAGEAEALQIPAEVVWKEGESFRKEEITGVESLLDWIRVLLSTEGSGGSAGGGGLFAESVSGKSRRERKSGESAVGAGNFELTDPRSFLRLGEDGVLYPGE